MAGKPRVAVISGFGINCELETMAVFEMAGASADRIHVNRLVGGEVSLEDYQIMAVPGGFSFGDHLGSGRLLGNRLRFGLREQVLEFVRAGKPVIGICNGFQVLIKMGLLPGDDEVSLTQTASLALNDSGHYEDRWVTLEFDSNSPCIWTKGMERIRVPVRHGEGKFVTDDPSFSISGPIQASWPCGTSTRNRSSPRLRTRSCPTRPRPTRAGATSPVFVIHRALCSGSCPTRRPTTLLGWEQLGHERTSSTARVRAWRFSIMRLNTLLLGCRIIPYPLTHPRFRVNVFQG